MDSGNRMLQISESDLAALESIMPSLASLICERGTPRLRTQLRRVKTILSDVRWNYGPHEECEIMPAADDDPSC